MNRRVFSLAAMLAALGVGVGVGTLPAAGAGMHGNGRNMMMRRRGRLQRPASPAAPVTPYHGVNGHMVSVGGAGRKQTFQPQPGDPKEIPLANLPRETPLR